MLEKIIPMDLFDTGWPQTFNLGKKKKKKKENTISKITVRQGTAK